MNAKLPWWRRNSFCGKSGEGRGILDLVHALCNVAALWLEGGIHRRGKCAVILGLSLDTQAVPGWRGDGARHCGSGRTGRTGRLLLWKLQHAPRSEEFVLHGPVSHLI